MAKLKPPPVTDKVVLDTGRLTPSWNQWVDQVFSGDRGQVWTPTFSGFTYTGATPKITGNYFQLSSVVCKFVIVIVPASGGDTTASSAYINNFPLTMALDDACSVVTNAPSSATGMCDSSTNRILLPNWSGITSRITITGSVIAS